MVAKVEHITQTGTVQKVLTATAQTMFATKKN